MTIFPGCPCCGKQGPCWRCYEADSCLSAEDYYDLEAEFTLLEYFDEQTETGRNLDKTAESGLPVGTRILTTDGYDFDIPGSGAGWEDPESAVWSIYGYYSSPEAIECQTNLDGSVTISPKINPRVTFYKNDDVDFCNQMRAGIGFEYPPAQWSSAVTAQSLTYDDGPDKKCIGYSSSGGSIKEFQLGVPYVFTSSVRDGSGNRQASLRWEVVIRKKASVKTETIESKQYKCFDAPPDEDGWTPVGDCHPDEESCAKECGPSVPFCVCEEPNVLGNELTMTLQNLIDTGYTPTETENITCTPDQLFSQIKALPFNAPFYGFSQSSGLSEGFDTATWSSESGNIADGMQAGAACVNYGNPAIDNPISCYAEEDLGTGCLKSFEEENLSVIPSKIEWTPKNVIVGMNLYQAGTPQRICDFANTGTTLLEFDKAYNTSSVEGFRVLACWENLDYIGDEAYPWPRFRYLTLAEFQTDMLLSVNGTPPGGRTMPTTTTGPGTELANLLKWFNIHAKEKGCGCKSMQKKMDKGGPQWCRDNKEEILDHLAKEAKKRKLPFIKLAASKLIDLAIRRSERG